MKTTRSLAGRALLPAFIIFLNIAALGQNKSYIAPVKWQRYSTGGGAISFEMPKLPVVYNFSEICRGEATTGFGSYANGAAYVVRITVEADVPDYCESKKKFDKKSFRERVEKLKSEYQLTESEEAQAKKSNEVKLAGKNSFYRLINDYKNKRWFEIYGYGAYETQPEAKNFLDSLKINENAGGLEIGGGAEQTLGDESFENPVDKTSAPFTGGTTDAEKENNGSNREKAVSPPDSLPIRLVVKPKARYSDAARRNRVQGTVVLRATFLASGGMGTVSVVKGLPDGLTEQAIEAARKILFLPAQKNNWRVSVTKTIEYAFTIY